MERLGSTREPTLPGREVAHVASSSPTYIFKSDNAMAWQLPGGIDRHRFNQVGVGCLLQVRDLSFVILLQPVLRLYEN
jgi:hypothetical protein